MNLTLHSYRRCPYAIRVRMMLEEKTLPYTVIEENLAEFSPALVALYQRLHGTDAEIKVPLLIYTLSTGEARAMTESATITAFLERSFPAPALLPADSATAVARWTEWCDTTFKPDLDLAKYEWRTLNPEARNALSTRLSQRFLELEIALQENTFLLGKTFSLADIHVFPFIRQYSKIPDIELQALLTSGVRTWLDGILARPSFARVMQKPATRT